MDDRRRLRELLLAGALLVAPAGAIHAQGTWSDLGPHFAGRLTALATVDGTNVWVGSEGGGVWKSTDGAASFFWPGNAGLTDFTVLDLAFDQLQPQRLYLRTWNGFWVSTDGAASWQRTLASQNGDGSRSYLSPDGYCGSCTNQTSAAWYNNFLPRTLAQWPIAASARTLVFTALPCEGIQYSLDSGATWSRAWPFPGGHQNPDNCIRSLAIDRVTGRLYLTTLGRNFTTQNKVYRSTAGWTAAGPPNPLQWEMIANGMPNEDSEIVGATSLAWGGSADRLMVVLDAFQDPLAQRAYAFDGTTWTARPNSDSAECPVSGSQSRALTWGGGGDFFEDGIVMAYTPNGGASWVCPQVQYAQHADVRGIFADSVHHRLWTVRDGANLGDQQAIVSYPWTAGGGLGPPSGSTGSGISSWLAYTVAVGGALDERVYVGAQDTYSACSDNGGGAWTGVGPVEPQAAFFAPSDGSVLYVLSAEGGLTRFVNAGSGGSCSGLTPASESLGGTLYGSRGVHALAVAPADAQRVFVAGFRWVNVSSDGGASWRPSVLPSTPPFLPGFGPCLGPSQGDCPDPTALYVDRSGAVYAGTAAKGAFRCTDAIHYCDGSAGSGQWQAWGLNPGPGVQAPDRISAITGTDPGSSPRFFLMATSNGLYRRVDDGEWRPVNGSEGRVASDVMIDPSCPARVYAGFGYLDNAARTGGGVYFSPVFGAPGTWQHLSGGTPLDASPVTQVTVTPATPARAYVSTYGRGAWRYDWGSQLPACVTTPPPCVADDTTLCLGGGRFRVRVTDTTPSGATGAGHGVALTDDTGYFWFFSSSNVEMLLKVLNACGVNRQFWVFAGGLTNVQATITVTDTHTGEVATFTNPQGTPFQPYQNTTALDCTAADGARAEEVAAATDTPPAQEDIREVEESFDGAPVAAPCTADSTHLCLNSGRFEVSTTWQTADGRTGAGQAVAITSDTGYFWFFSASNVEMVLKVLDGCSVGGHYWVFAGGLTNVRVTTTVRDTRSGRVRTYVNAQNTPFAPLQDTAAFATCP